MHEIYLWESERNCPNRLIGWYDSEHSPDNLIFWQGQHVNKKEFIGAFDKQYHEYPIINFKVTREALDNRDYLTAISAPVVSERLKHLIEELAPNDVEFFEAKVVCNDGELEGYYVLNVTSLIKGIDHEKSICRYDEKDTSWLRRFDYLTYLPDCMGNHVFARDTEYSLNLLVREDAVKAIEAAKMKGVYFVRPEDFYRPITYRDLIDGPPDEDE